MKAARSLTTQQIARWNEMAVRLGEAPFGLSLAELRTQCQQRSLNVGPEPITVLIDPADLAIVVETPSGAWRML